MSDLIDSVLRAATGAADESLLDVLEQAVQLGVRENDRLDWKRKYSKDGGGDEFAKDVAALANTRGGLLVVGIAENPRTSAASQIQPLPVDDHLERTMRSWLPTRMEPPAPGLRFHPAVDATGAGVLIVEVPESPDKPHQVISKTGKGYPIRFGTQTEWMREHDIERAYRLRFDRLASEEARLAELIDQTTEHLDFADGFWIVAAARPSLPRSQFDELTRGQVVSMFQKASALHDELVPDGAGVGKAYSSLGHMLLNPQLGLRRWVAANRSQMSPSARSDGLHIEIHNDGSVVIAVQAWQGRGVDGSDRINLLTDVEINSAVVALVNLVAVTSSELDVESDHAVRIECRVGDARALGMAIPRRTNQVVFGHEQPSGSREIPRLIPVESVLPASTSTSARRRSALRLVGDVAAQFGIAARDFYFTWAEDLLVDREPAANSDAPDTTDEES